MHTLHGNYENLNHFYMCFRIGWSIVKKKVTLTIVLEGIL